MSDEMKQDKKGDTALRNKAIQVRVNEDEYNLIENNAKELGVTLSNYIRFVCTHCTINVTVDVTSKDLTR